MKQGMNLKALVKVKLGEKERELRLDMNMLCELEEFLGVSIMQSQSFFENLGFRELRAMVWAMLYRETPRPDLNTVGDWVSEGDLADLSEKIMTAWSQDIEKTDDAKAKGDAKDVADPTKA